MEFDWNSGEKTLDIFELDNLGFEKFNENSIINNNKIYNIFINKEINEKFNEEINEKQNKYCSESIYFEESNKLNLDIKTCNDLIVILNEMSLISTNLRTNMRNKSQKYREYKSIDNVEYKNIIKLIEWLILAINSVKSHFVIPIEKDNSYNINNKKLFKTSSYKFCNLKENCQIHKKKICKCDKNHFVFDMVYNDVLNLYKSIEFLGIENINWLLSNKFIKQSFDIDNNIIIEKIEKNEIINNDLLDKNIIFKSFDVISFVLKKMYEESIYFLINNNESLLINMKKQY